ncbi:Cof-type HAD-IIB family hydrolase [Paenibacillus yanchengensis]|uniref:Cof-type HAD-IIB family hydrolase n=1 Tax=Paenibacillus yanchengensis TaxID=2035833 RepID=A0ABW4YGE6_9BACL
MSYKIVFFDIDGTLVNDEKVIPADTVQAIQQLKATGVEPVIATGRAPYFIQPLMKQLGIASYVSLNGAYAVYKGEVVFQQAMDRTSIEKLVEIAERHEHPLVFEGTKQFATNQENHPAMVAAVSSLKVTLPAYNPQFWQQHNIMQIFLHCTSSDEHLYAALHDDLTFIRWHEQAMDVLPLGLSKAVGIEAMLNKLGLTNADAVAFGDGLNDKEMLRAVGLGIAMGNSHADLLPHADFVTTHVDEQGIRNGLIKAALLPA